MLRRCSPRRTCWGSRSCCRRRSRGAARTGAPDARGRHHPAAGHIDPDALLDTRVMARELEAAYRRNPDLRPTDWDFGLWRDGRKRFLGSPGSRGRTRCGRNVPSSGCPCRSRSGPCRTPSCCAPCLVSAAARPRWPGRRSRSSARRSGTGPVGQHAAGVGVLTALGDLPDWAVHVAQGTLVTGVVAGIVWLASTHVSWGGAVRKWLAALATVVALALSPLGAFADVQHAQPGLSVAVARSQRAAAQAPARSPQGLHPARGQDEPVQRSAAGVGRAGAACAGAWRGRAAVRDDLPAGQLLHRWTQLRALYEIHDGSASSSPRPPSV